MQFSTTSSTTSTHAYSSAGLSGLASGLDTESMVKALLSGTQSKIDKQNALHKQTEWRQDIYRDIISKINTFQTSYFGTSSSTSLTNQSFFNAMKAASTATSFKATASSLAAAGNTNLQVRRLATSTSITSGSTVSGKLAGTMDANALNALIQKQVGADANYTLSLTVGGQAVTADLRSVFVSQTTDGGGNPVNVPRAYSSGAAGQQEIGEEIENALNSAFSAAGVNVSAAVENGALSFTGADAASPIIVSSASGDLALARLGLSAGNRSQANTSNTQTVLKSTLDPVPAIKFQVSLDGLSKDISLSLHDITDAYGSVDLAKVGTTLQSELDAAHGAGQVNLALDAGTGAFELRVSAGRKVMIGGNQTTLTAFDVKNGQSNRIGMGGALQDLYFSNALQGGSFKFAINGQQFSFNERTTMTEVMNAINGSDAGVRVVYKTQDDIFTIESTESGKGRNITMSQQEGNLLNAMFGSGYTDGVTSASLTAGSTVRSTTLTTGDIPGAPVLNDSEFEVAEGKLSLVVNGSNYSFSVSKKTDGSNYTKDQLITELNKQFDAKFGTGAIKLTTEGNLAVANGSAVTVKVDPLTDTSESVVKLKAKSGDLGLAFFGIGGATNIATGATTLNDVGLSGILASGGNTLDGSTTLDQLATLTNNLKFEDGRLVLTDSGTGIQVGSAEQTKQLFGTSSLTLGAEQGSVSALSAGQNALVKIDGLLTERSSNVFSANGIDFNLLQTSGSYTSGKVYNTTGDEITLAAGNYIEDGTLYDAYGQKVDGWGYTSSDIVFKDESGNVINGATGIDANGNLFLGTTETVAVSRDTDQIVDGIKGFIDEYNKLIKTLNDYLDEDTNYKSYAPLTDDQKKEMSDKEIELWEEKSKQGLLHNDATIEGFLQSMRTALYQRPEGSSIAIYDLGIDTGEWETKGQLVLSSDGETQLRKMIESDSAGILNLFTDSDNGIATKLNGIIDSVAKTSSGSPGALVQLAGVKGKASATTNTLTNQLKEIDDKLDDLKAKYETEKARYWKQFNAMESLISNMNSQSSWLTQQFSS